MKEQSLIEMKKKVDHMDLILKKVITELTNLGDLSVGTFETVKKMPGYEKAIEEVKTEALTRLIKTNKNGIPDIVALHPDKRIEFYEVKTSKGKVSSLQEYRLKELKKYGFKAEVYRG